MNETHTRDLAQRSVDETYGRDKGKRQICLQGTPRMSCADSKAPTVSKENANRNRIL